MNENDFFNNLEKQFKGKRQELNNLVDSLAQIEPGFKCLQISNKFQNIDTELLKKISISNNMAIQNNYINLMSQFIKLLIDFNSEYLEQNSP